MSRDKKSLGQFYTTNYKYILKDLDIPRDVKNIVEPFAGNGDLVKFIDQDKYNLETYDIDPKKDFITRRDTLLEPPNYQDKFVITNPPYLARNKCHDKTIFNKYDSNDLYKCFLLSLIGTKIIGGIIIIPLNFISSIRKSDIELRKKFLSVFDIVRLNIFEEQVFEDTSYTVCSFLFTQKTDSKQIEAVIFPNKQELQFFLNKKNNYTVGGEIYQLTTSDKYQVDRATKKTKSKDCITNILVKCIDDSETSKIKLSMVEEKQIYIDKTPNLSARSYASLVIQPKLFLDQQKEIVSKFNSFLEENRKKYNSLFLTNYRESKGIARKRISFSLVFQIVSHLLHSSPPEEPEGASLVVEDDSE